MSRLELHSAKLIPKRSRASGVVQISGRKPWRESAEVLSVVIVTYAVKATIAHAAFAEFSSDIHDVSLSVNIRSRSSLRGASWTMNAITCRAAR